MPAAAAAAASVSSAATSGVPSAVHFTVPSTVPTTLPSAQTGNISLLRSVAWEKALTRKEWKMYL